MQATVNKANKKQFEKSGILFPFPALKKQELEKYRNDYGKLEAFYNDQPQPSDLKQLHLFFSWAYELATHPTILDQIEEILGPNILIHSSSIFSKKPNDNFYVSWHQDGYYIGLNKSKLVSAWVALSDSNMENGCLRVIPETHLKKYKHKEEKDERNMLSSGMMISERLYEDQALDIVLKAGEMSLHHVDIVHGSNPNHSKEKRIGFAIRYIAPEVKQALTHYDVVLARGQDNYGHYNLLKEKPVEESIELSIKKQQVFHKGLLEKRKQFFQQKNQKK